MELRTLLRTPILGKAIVGLALAVVIVPLFIAARVVIWALAPSSVTVVAPRMVTVQVAIDGEPQTSPVVSGTHRGYSIGRGPHVVTLTTAGGSIDVEVEADRPPWLATLWAPTDALSGDLLLTLPETCYALVDVTAPALGEGSAQVLERMRGGTPVPLRPGVQPHQRVPLFLDDGERLRWWQQIDCDPFPTDLEIEQAADALARR